MGDRVVFHVFDGRKIGPAVYAHWSGSEWPAILSALRKRMDARRDDLSYATARLVQAAIGDSNGDTGFGAWNCPHADEPAKAWEIITGKDYSHGDAGVILIDCRDFQAFAHGGYAADSEQEEHLDAPPKTWAEAVHAIKSRPARKRFLLAFYEHEWLGRDRESLREGTAEAGYDPDEIDAPDRYAIFEKLELPGRGDVAVSTFRTRAQVEERLAEISVDAADNSWHPCAVLDLDAARELHWRTTCRLLTPKSDSTILSASTSGRRAAESETT